MKKQLLFLSVAVSIIIFPEGIKAIEKKELETILTTNKAHKAFTQGQKVFESIKRIWNAQGSTIDDINNKVITHSMNMSIEKVEDILEKNTQAIPSTEIIHLITTIKTLKPIYNPLTANLSPNAIATLKAIFEATKNTYKRLIESHSIVKNYNVSAEIIGVGPSYDNLAETLLATIASIIKEYNNAPGVKRFSPKLQQIEAEKNADNQIKALEAQLAVNIVN